MKILFLTPNTKGLVCIECFYHLEQAVSRVAECKWAGTGHELYREERVDDTVRRLYGNDPPDWVIMAPFFIQEGNRWLRFTASKDRDYKIAAYITDIHSLHSYSSPERYVKILNNADYDAVILLYEKVGYARKTFDGQYDFYQIDENYYVDNLEMATYFLPPAVDSDVFKPLDEPRIYDVAFLGVIDRVQYPLRCRIHNELPDLAKKKGWKYLIRNRPPGRSSERYVNEAEGYVGERYAKALAQSKVFIFGCSIYRYPLLKFFEAMACRTLVMADRPLSMEKLHLRPFYNFVEISEDDWKPKLNAWLQPEMEDERKEIAQRGYETFLKHHTTEVRARQLIEFLKEDS